MSKRMAKTPEIIKSILTGLSEGKTVRAVCIDTGISQRVLWNWLARDDELMRKYVESKVKKE